METLKFIKRKNGSSSYPKNLIWATEERSEYFMKHCFNERWINDDWEGSLKFAAELHGCKIEVKEEDEYFKIKCPACKSDLETYIDDDLEKSMGDKVTRCVNYPVCNFKKVSKR